MKITAKFEIDTHDLQKTVIALIHSKHCADSTLTEEDHDRLINLFSELNGLCTERNNYTLSVEVTA